MGRVLLRVLHGRNEIGVAMKKCPECGYELDLDEGEPQSFDSPGYGPELFCVECGYTEPYYGDGSDLEPARRLFFLALLFGWMDGDL